MFINDFCFIFCMGDYFEFMNYAEFIYEISKDALLPAIEVGLTSALIGIYSERKALEEKLNFLFPGLQGYTLTDEGKKILERRFRLI